MDRANTLESIKKIQEINSSFPYTEPIKEWKAQGKKVVGWACNYVPEEIIHAAGMLPIRVTGNSEELMLQHAEAYIFTGSCSFIRSCFELAITKQLDFLDGYVASACCSNILRMAEIWNYHIDNIPVIYLLDVPRKNYEVNGYEYYKGEILEFQHQLEQFARVQISDDALRESIAVYNKTRELLKRLYELRKADNPPISGAEVLEVTNAAVRMPREDYNKLLEDLLEEISQTQRSLPGGIRLMLSGCILNNPQFISGIEGLGAIVVIDELCTGARYFWDVVESNPNLSPIEALSHRYFSIFPCPRTVDSSVRFERIIELAKEYRVKGIIIEILRNCANMVHDLFLFREKLEENGIPFYELDIEYGTPLTGPLRTRVEAFLETLGLLPETKREE